MHLARQVELAVAAALAELERHAAEGARPRRVGGRLAGVGTLARSEELGLLEGGELDLGQIVRRFEQRVVWAGLVRLLGDGTRLVERGLALGFGRRLALELALLLLLLLPGVLVAYTVYTSYITLCAWCCWPGSRSADRPYVVRNHNVLLEP